MVLGCACRDAKVGGLDRTRCVWEVGQKMCTDMRRAEKGGSGSKDKDDDGKPKKRLKEKEREGPDSLSFFLLPF